MVPPGLLTTSAWRLIDSAEASGGFRLVVACMSLGGRFRQPPLLPDDRQPVSFELVARRSAVSELFAFEHEPTDAFQEGRYRVARVCRGAAASWLRGGALPLLGSGHAARGTVAGDEVGSHGVPHVARRGISESGA
jgi:hypothetical protein